MKKRYYKLTNIIISINTRLNNLLERNIQFWHVFPKKNPFFIKNSNSFFQKKSFRQH